MECGKAVDTQCSRYDLVSHLLPDVIRRDDGWIMDSHIGVPVQAHEEHGGKVPQFPAPEANEGHHHRVDTDHLISLLRLMAGDDAVWHPDELYGYRTI